MVVLFQTSAPEYGGGYYVKVESLSLDKINPDFRSGRGHDWFDNGEYIKRRREEARGRGGRN